MPDIVDRLINAINSHDLEALMRCYGPAATVVGPELQTEGPEEIASYHGHIWDAFPDVSLTVWEKITDGDGTVVEACATGTHTGPFLLAGGEVIDATHRCISVRHCWVFSVEDGLIASHRVYFDQLELYSQLGVQLLAAPGRPPG